MIQKLVLTVALVISLCSCQHEIKTADRDEFKNNNDKMTVERITEGSSHSEQISPISDKDLEKYAYELGLDPRTGLNADERKSVSQRRRVRELERTLDSEKERRHYSKVLPLMQTDDEKIDYLSIESIEGRQAWVNRNKIWSRLKSKKDFQELIASQDIAVGMTADLVKKSWGNPESVEYSGNEIYKNERWKYTREVPSPSGYMHERRFVYFEGGRVVGWETE
jgi:hypothetical protein